MSITTKTRKQLWGLSGNRCAICKEELFASGEVPEDSFNIGDECHIISKQQNGPRHVSGLPDYDIYENLILLCKNHHKEIDTLTKTYPEELLRFMKTNHENWVRATLDGSSENDESEKAKFIRRITSGKELLNILDSAHGYRIDYDEPETDEEYEYIGGVLQTFTDYGDLTGMISSEQGEKVKLSVELKKLLVELESKGYFVFAERVVEPMNSNPNDNETWDIVTLLLKSSSSENIIKL